VDVFLPSIMRPLPGETGLAAPRVQRIAEEPFSVIRGPTGSYRAESLAGLIAGWGRWQDCVWLRAPSSRPVAGLLLQACRYRWADGQDQETADADPAGQLEEALRLAWSWSWRVGSPPGWPGWARPSARSPATGVCG
jgi:hypothetical protein